MTFSKRGGKQAWKDIKDGFSCQTTTRNLLLALLITACEPKFKSIFSKQASEENASDLDRELTLRKQELSRVGKVASRAAHREATTIKEDGMIEFHLHKEEVALSVFLYWSSLR